MDTSNNTHWMLQALELAQRYRGFCAPNPAVGAVVVQNNRVIGQGAHQGCGQAHAEVLALATETQDLSNASLFVTLEPCCHHGRTPPCTDLILASGIKHVVLGYLDPNPQVSGKGVAILRAAGISVEHLNLDAVNQFYHSYHYWTATQRPWVTAKLAMSLDGKIAAADGSPVAITGSACQQLTHQWRRQSDGILSTIRTILNDDPQLNVRLTQEALDKPLFILDSHLRLPTTARIVQNRRPVHVLHNETASKQKQLQLQALGIECIKITKTQHGLDLNAVLDYVGQQGLHDLWVEAGSLCFSHLVSQQLANRVLLYLAPHCLGTRAHQAFPAECASLFDQLKSIKWQQYGNDCVANILLAESCCMTT